MGGATANDGKGLGSDATALRDHFLGWQCRLRQMAMRRGGGRPSPGMRPQVLGDDGRALAVAITILIHHHDPSQATDAFRHIVRRTNDPKERYWAALELLSAAHFQRPADFSDVMTAGFADASPLAATLTDWGRCVLDFQEHRQSYRLPCAVAAIAPEAPAWQAAYWHNAMFNPELPGEVAMLAFTPDWSRAAAEPGPPRLH